jgi:aspartate/methionine/tyrosine aminotransferase
MTGWRLGWIVLPPALLDGVAKLIEFNTSCAPVFVQRGGQAAVQMANDFVPQLAARMKRCRDTLLPLLADLPGVEVQAPLGGMYAFFRIAGQDDSLTLAKRLVREAGLGLAPGAAFGAEGAGWLRWCFASRDPQRLVEGVTRLAGNLGL